MKKYLILPTLFALFMLVGCDINIGYNSSKAEEFANKAEELGNEFQRVKKETERLENKKNLTASDQKQIVKNVESLSKVIDNFENEEAPILAKKAKKFAVKILREKEEELLSFKEKAENGTATEKDVEMMIDALSDNIEVKLLGK